MNTFIFDIDGTLLDNVEAYLYGLQKTLRRHGLDEAFAEQDGELGLGHGPLTRRHFPLFLGSVQDQIEQLGRGIVVGEVPPGPDRPPELGIQSLDGVRCIDDPADIVGEGARRLTGCERSDNQDENRLLGCR